MRRFRAMLTPRWIRPQRTRSWGTVLLLNPTIGSAGDVYTSALVIQFQGAMGVGRETLTLRNYAVVRLP